MPRRMAEAWAGFRLIEGAISAWRQHVTDYSAWHPPWPAISPAVPYPELCLPPRGSSGQSTRSELLIRFGVLGSSGAVARNAVGFSESFRRPSYLP